MKVLFFLFLTMTTPVLSQELPAAFGQDLPAVPVEQDPVDLRLELASGQLRKAACSREASLYVGLLGAAGTLIMVRTDPTLATWIGGVTVAGFYTLQLKGAGHDRKAGNALHRRK